MVENQSIIQFYFLNTSFHGYKYIAEKERHWTERLFWIFWCILSWFASGLLMRSAWYDFQNNAISFVAETNYLEWNTQFPSITVCETDNQIKIAELTDRLYGDPHDYNLDEILKELVYYKGLSFYTLQLCGPESPSISEHCFKHNYTDFNRWVTSTCTELFKSCQWNDQIFNCCEYFDVLPTELGNCFAINSVQTRHKKISKKFPMVSNKSNGPGQLRLELFGYANVYIMGEQEVPTLTTSPADFVQVTPHIQYSRYIAITEIENQEEVKDVSIEQRKCRFIYENNLEVYPHYSYSACTIQCRKDAQYKTCECAHHLLPMTPFERQCNITGLNCLNKNYNNLAVLKASWSTRTGLVCECLPSCTELELSIVKDDKIGISEEYAIVELILERLPTERFLRKVVRGKLDLVVSMGGTTALFLGASVLSFVEIFYYFTIRPLSNSIMLKKRRKQKKYFH